MCVRVCIQSAAEWIYLDLQRYICVLLINGIVMYHNRVTNSFRRSGHTTFVDIIKILYILLGIFVGINTQS